MTDNERMMKLSEQIRKDYASMDRPYNIFHGWANEAAQLEEEIAALKREIVWLLQNEPPDDLGMYTQTKRNEWCARRDALLKE